MTVLEGTLKDADRERCGVPWKEFGRRTSRELDHCGFSIQGQVGDICFFVDIAADLNSAWFSTNERPPNVRAIHVAELGTFKAGFPDEAAAEEAAAEQPVAEQPGVREYVIV